jgi:exonuclease SbcD
MRFSFLHTSDLHLDRPLRGAGRVSPRVAEYLVHAALETWDTIVDLAIERRVAFILIAGDFVGTDARSLRAQVHAARGLVRLAEQGIETIIVPGADDPSELANDIAKAWPGLVDEHGSLPARTTLLARGAGRMRDRIGSPGDTVPRDTVPRDDGSEHWVVRIPGAARRNSSSMTADPDTVLATIHTGLADASHGVVSAGVSGSGGPGDDAELGPGLHIGLAHARLGSDRRKTSGGSSAPFQTTARQLKRARFDYWALGHHHQHEVIQDGKPWIVYPGTPQGRGPEFGESGPKGVVITTFDRDPGGVSSIVGVEFVPVDRVRYIEIEAGIEKGASVETIVESLERALEEARRETSRRAPTLIARARLRARSQVSTADAFAGRILSPENRSEILRRLRRAQEEVHPVVGWSDLHAEILDDAALCLSGDRLPGERETGKRDKGIAADAMTRPELPHDFIADFHAVVAPYTSRRAEDGDGDEPVSSARPIDSLVAESWRRLSELGVDRHVAALKSEAVQDIVRRAELLAVVALEKEMEE